MGALKTTAKRLPDGTFSIAGTKCFISAGDHDLTENIIHPVLARIEGDPPGTKGISIFLVPKYRVNDDGSLGDLNDIRTGNIEHKMGIKGSATATLNFGDDGKCIGELLGNEREGMKIMNLFHLIDANIAKLKGATGFDRYVSYLEESANALLDLIMHFGQAGQSGDFLSPILNAGPFLEIMGDVLIGHFLMDGARIAEEKLNNVYASKGADSPEKQAALAKDDSEVAFYTGKVATARYFAVNVLSGVKVRCEALKVGEKAPLEIVEDAFAF